MSPLAGRVAVVTGASRGIGRAIAARLRADGAEVVISGRDRATLERTADELGVIGVQADAIDAAQCALPVERALADHGRIDVLINNVGGVAGGNPDLFDGADGAFEATLDLNLTAAYRATRAAAPAMRDGGYGRIVNIGSGASNRAVASLGYTAAKHGLVGLTRQLAQQLGTLGITVNCVCPGWTDTDLVDFERMGAAQGISAAEARAEAESQSAQQRIIDPSEVAPVVAFLATPEAGAITGQIIGADGGFHL